MISILILLVPIINVNVSIILHESLHHGNFSLSSICHEFLFHFHNHGFKVSFITCIIAFFKFIFKVKRRFRRIAFNFAGINRAPAGALQITQVSSERWAVPFCRNGKKVPARRKTGRDFFYSPISTRLPSNAKPYLRILSFLTPLSSSICSYFFSSICLSAFATVSSSVFSPFFSFFTLFDYYRVVF